MIGFQVVPRQHDGDVVQHAELRLGQVVETLASDAAGCSIAPVVGRSTDAGLHARMDDADAVFAAATGACATEALPPEDAEWVGRRTRVLDPQGRGWGVGTSEPGHAGS